mmetsp:Transcript_31594/g.66003  ORF Transcript_31594/g.66003 Transcript_31594/m.66003 type:complete len:83 (-) Transcript_31594:296-544(-)
MGCSGSKSGFATVDDSVHVMMKHDKKTAVQKGEALQPAYVPRAPHPLLGGGGESGRPAVVATEEEEEDGAGGAPTEKTTEEQ